MFFNKIPTAWGLINNLLSKLFGYTNLPYCKRTWLGFWENPSLRIPRK